MDNKKKLLTFVEGRTGVKLDADKLLIGFSRRAAPYKRSNFIFTDRKFIEPLLKSGRIQIVFSGKAHPLDDNGKQIVQTILEMTRRYPGSVVFLENYDMEIGRMLTRGSDVWLNNPRRPKEASGTSGMKAAMNGVLNLSILDGWWPEACQHGVNGWQFGDGFESEDEVVLDKHDFKAFRKPVFPADQPVIHEWLQRVGIAGHADFRPAGETESGDQFASSVTRYGKRRVCSHLRRRLLCAAGPVG